MLLLWLSLLLALPWDLFFFFKLGKRLGVLGLWQKATVFTAGDQQRTEGAFCFSGSHPPFSSECRVCGLKESKSHQRHELSPCTPTLSASWVCFAMNRMSHDSPITGICMCMPWPLCLLLQRPVATRGLCGLGSLGRLCGRARAQTLSLKVPACPPPLTKVTTFLLCN